MYIYHMWDIQCYLYVCIIIQYLPVHWHMDLTTFNADLNELEKAESNGITISNMTFFEISPPYIWLHDAALLFQSIPQAKVHAGESPNTKQGVITRVDRGDEEIFSYYVQLEEGGEPRLSGLDSCKVARSAVKLQVSSASCCLLRDLSLFCDDWFCLVNIPGGI